MRLINWIARSDYPNVKAFAKAAGLAHPTVYAALNGRPVNLTSARKISKVTGGKVSAISLREGRAA